MLLPAANGLVAVKDVKAPPLKLPDTLAEEMLSPAPSVSAAAGLVKYAYSVTAPNSTGTAQLVVTLTGALAFVAPFGTRLKFTKPGAAVIVMELVSVALRFTLAAFEFSCAQTLDGSRVKAAASNARAKLLHPIRLSARTPVFR